MVLLTAIALITSIGSPFLFYYQPWVKPITVDPISISLGQLPWQIQTDFYVHNNTRRTLFDIWVMIAFNDVSIKPSYIDINTPDSEQSASGVTGNILVNFTIVRFDGKITSDNRQVIFLLIHQLTPDETRGFSANINCYNDAYVGLNPALSLQVLKHSNTPTAVINNGSELAYNFTPPISFTQSGMSLYMKKLS